MSDRNPLHPGDVKRPPKATQDTDESPADLSLWQRLFRAQKEAQDVPRTGTAPPEIGGYAFAEAHHVLGCARALWSRHGIASSLTCLSSRSEAIGTSRDGRQIRTRASVEVALELRNPDRPEEVVTLTWPGVADDTGDKAVAKALTAARKGVVLAAMGVTGGDPDSDAEAPDTTTPAPSPVASHAAAPQAPAAPRPARQAQAQEEASGETGAAPANSSRRVEDRFGACGLNGCDGVLELVSGVSRQGRPYRLVRCSDRDCPRQVDWSPDVKAYRAGQTGDPYDPAEIPV